MYICLECGALLESTVSIPVLHDEVDDQSIKTYHGCPYCKSDQVEEAKQCDLCGKYVVNDYIELKDGTTACHDCFKLY